MEQKAEVWEVATSWLPEKGQRLKFSKLALEDKLQCLENKSSQVHVTHPSAPHFCGDKHIYLRFQIARLTRKSGPSCLHKRTHI